MGDHQRGAQLFTVHARAMTAIKTDGTFDRTSVTLLGLTTGDHSIKTLMASIKDLQQIAVGDLGAGADLRLQMVHW